MLRRILIIILVVVVIIAAIFAIRWFLNRGSDEAESPDGSAAVVIDESAQAGEDSISPGEAVIVEERLEDRQEEAAEGSEAYPVEGGEAAPAEGGEAAPADDGEATPAEDSEAVPAEGGEAAPAESGETAPAETTGDPSLGGVAESGDTNVGGGIPADAETSATGDAAAVEPVQDGTGTGSAAAESPAATFVEPGVPTQHTVENLEWLTQLARCYGTTVADIQAANNYACPDLIHPGWVVNISNPGNAGPITINEQPCFNYHTVQQGETLYSIATQYGISYQWLARINAIYNYDFIYAGQQLVIPNPVDPVFTQIPAEPFFYSNCWGNYCPVYPVYPIYSIYPVPEPYQK